MRRRGWGESRPATDEEAYERIRCAAKAAIDRGEDVNIANIARVVGVTRQTVYRYFPTTDELLVAAAADSAARFFDRLATHLAGVDDPAAAIVEATAYMLETLPQDRYVRRLLAPARSAAFSARFTSETARTLARSLLQRFDVDWTGAGFSDDDLDELTEQTLRTLQSFMLDPGHPPRTGPELRRYLHRWLGVAVEHHRALPDRSNRSSRTSGKATRRRGPALESR